MLSGINFRFQAGRRYAIVGASGCGKSTLLNLLAGLIQPTQGSIEGLVAKYSLVLQDLGLFPWKNVRENIALPLQLRGKKLSCALPFQLGLEALLERKLSQLSGGQLQRVALARALVTEPEMLLLDEPFSAVDAITRESLQDLVLELWRTRRFLTVLITHDVQEAVYFGETILVLQAGKISHQMENAESSRSNWRKDPLLFTRSCELRNLLAKR